MLILRVFLRMDNYTESVVILTCEFFFWVMGEGCVEARTLLDTFCGRGNHGVVVWKTG